MSNFARYHAELRQAVASRKGQELQTATIKTLFEQKHPNLDSAWVRPSDHCDNHICKGACECAETNGAIFSKIKRGLYLVI